MVQNGIAEGALLATKWMSWVSIHDQCQIHRK